MKRFKTRQTSKPYSKIRQLLFFLLILLLPTQLGKHFFLPFSYLSGVRVDLLSPTIYLIDLVVFFLAATNIKTLFKFFSGRIGGFLFGLLALNAIFSQSWPLAVYGSARIVEFLIIVALGKKLLAELGEKLILVALLSGALVEFLLSLYQFILKHSIQGPLYFIGERLFTLATPGIAKVALMGAEYLRPYGSFSHPNSLAGFYLLLYFFVLTRKSFEKYFWLKNSLLLVSTLLIFLSFSKVAIGTFLTLNILYLIFTSKKAFCKICILSRTVIMVVVASIFLMGQGDPLTVAKRLELMGNAWEIIKKAPLFGVGLNNYLLAQADFVSKFPLFFNQPVHNIFLLALAEGGVILTGLAAYFLFRLPAFLLLAVVVTGLFDHYWLTLMQNFLLLAVVFSITLQGRDGRSRLRR